MGRSMNLSKKAQKEMLKMETYAKFPFLIEITRFSDNDDIEIYRYVNADKDVEFDGNVYNACYFVISPPEKTTESFSDAKLTLSALDYEWIEKIRTTKRRAKIRFVASIVYEENNIEHIEPIEDEEFMLTNVNWQDDTIQWTMKFDENMDIKFPLEIVDIRICPALS